MVADVVISGERQVAKSRLLENGLRAASGFHAMGLREGETVALLMRNDFAFLEVTHAAAALGVYAVPVNWHFKSEEAAYVLEDCGARILVAHADLLAAIRDVVPADVRIIVVPTPPEARRDFKVAAELCAMPDGLPEWNTWRDQYEPWSASPPAIRATMIYTSGTTGRPKGVRRQPMTAEQTVAQRALFAQVYGVRQGMRAMVAGPLYHASPNAFARQALVHADVIVLQSRFDPEATLNDIARYQITTLVMVPTMFVRLLKLPADIRAKYDVSSVRCVTHTAAPCPADVKRAMIEWWGPVLNETYGGTEVGIAVACTSEEWLQQPGTVGRPTAQTVLRIYDDDGVEQPDGQAGEIYMRCSAYSDFTYHNQAERRSKIERDGLISVGDVGFTKNGFLFLCDRKIDMVIVGGVNIYPAEIESCLLQNPDVHDCAVFGIPDDEMGERLVAVVERVPGSMIHEADVLTYLGQHLANYKIPRQVIFQADLPREDSGKIFKRQLREPFWKDRQVRI